MTSRFYLNFRQERSNISYRECIFIRDGIFPCGSIDYHIGRKQYMLRLNNHTTTYHNTIHQARAKAEAVLSRVYTVTQCYNN